VRRASVSSSCEGEEMVSMSEECGVRGGVGGVEAGKKAR